MTNKTLNKIILSATTAMFLTACGSSGSSTPSAADTASAKIQAYADDNSNPAPTVADYTAAGVTSITDANLAAMNQLVDSKTGEEVDELSELTSLAGEVDVTAPVITLLGSPTVSIVAGTTYTDAGATAEDTKDGSLTVTVGGDTVDTDIPETYTITYNVSDAAGNAATEVTRVVTVTTAPVLDTTAPVISLDGDDTVTILINTPYTDAGATASDDTDGNITAAIQATSIDLNTSGEQLITYTVSDAAGNEATEVTRTVIVSDTQFVAEGDTVTDLISGLVWDKTESNISACPTLPTIEQFQTIIDYTKSELAVVDGFNLPADDTHYKTSDDWDIRLKFGIVSNVDTATKTICVDTTSYIAPVAVTYEKVSESDTNITASNGLVWTDTYFSEFNYAPQTLSVAKDKCTELDMRLPTLVELDSIYDRADHNISEGFTTTYSTTYWTDTVAVADPSQNWIVSFDDNATTGSWAGMITGLVNDDTEKAYVRCVK